MNNKTNVTPRKPKKTAGLKAVFANCSLKRDKKDSHTAVLMSVADKIMREHGISTEYVHMAAHEVAFGVQPDMTKEGWERDDWPRLWKKFRDADILIVGTPIWLGEESSVCRLLIERLYAMSGKLNENGQSIFYGKVGGVVVTGNEDGIKHCAMTVLYALQHLGYIVPPQADCGWIGEAGPGPSYADERDDQPPVGFDNEFTQRNATIMTWNLIHMASILKEAGGLPRYGNDRNAWKEGNRYGYEDPSATR